MKLSGSKKRGRHLGGKGKLAVADAPELYFDEDDEIISYDETDNPAEKEPKNRRKKARLIILVILAILVGTGGFLYFYIRHAFDTQPPVRPAPWSDDHRPPVNPTAAVPAVSGQTPPEPGVVAYTRPEDELKYTFLLLGTDNGNGNTDVLMTITFDAIAHTLEIVNIPRDTLVNVEWNDIKKANSIFANMYYRHGWNEKELDAVMDNTVERFAEILGYKVDYWLIVDLKAFEALVDAIGGVDFYVPVRMDYEDPYQNLYIHYAKGNQHLNGRQALEVVRFRSGYSNADIGRINTQQEFLMTAAKQILEKKNSINIIELANIFLKYVKTDKNLKLSNLIWLGKEALKLSSETINFSILPGNYLDYFAGESYVTIYVDQWLELVNSKLNPYNEPITPDGVSILTRGPGGALYVTDGNYRGNPNWIYNSPGYSNPPPNTGQPTDPPPTTNKDPNPSDHGNEDPGNIGETPGPTDDGGSPGDSDPNPDGSQNNPEEPDDPEKHGNDNPGNPPESEPPGTEVTDPPENPDISPPAASEQPSESQND